MWSWFREELKLKRFSLRLEDPNVLTESAALSTLLFLLVRLIITLFLVACTIWSGFDDSNGDTKWFIYLTNWSFAILTVTFILLTVLSLSKKYHLHRSNPSADDYGTFETSVEAARRIEGIELSGNENQDTGISFPQPTPCKWYHQVTWLIYNVSFCAAFIVTIAYWIFQAKNPQFLDVVTHAFNTIFVVTEVLLGCVPIQLLHGLYTVIYLSIYVIFTVIYWQADGLNARGKPYIYKVFDYEDKNPGVLVAFTLLLAVIGPPFSQLALLGLYKLRCRIFRYHTTA